MNTAAMLDDLGQEVLEATSGEQALRILRRTSGVTLGLSRRPALPIVLATGFSKLQGSPVMWYHVTT